MTKTLESQHRELCGAVVAYLNGLSSPANSHNGSIDSCERRLEHLAELVGVEYRNPRPFVHCARLRDD